MNEIKQQIINLLNKADELIPSELLPDLPPTKYSSGMPESHSFENSIWMFGEEIRHLFIKSKSLKKDRELQSRICSIACNPKGKGGRQSFIMLLGNVASTDFAPQIAQQLTDSDVDGHAISTLLKMKCPNYVEEIKPFTDSKIAWVRNEAKRYIERYTIA